MCNKYFFKTTIIVLLWIGINIILNLYNGWMFSQKDLFGFPITITCLDMLFSFGACVILNKCFQLGIFPKFKDKSNVLQYGKILCIISIYFCFNIILNNASLMTISISTNQIIRASIPFIMLLSELLMHKKIPSLLICISMIPIVFGVIIAVYHDPNLHLIGCCMVFLASILVVFWTIESSNLMKNKTFDSIGLLYYMSPISFIMLTYVSTGIEYCTFRHNIIENPEIYILVIGIQCILSLLYNFIHYSMVCYLLPLTSTVLGNIKTILIVVIDILFLNETKPNIQNVTGIILTLLGSIFYSYLNYKENKNKFLKKDQYEIDKHSKILDLIINNNQHDYENKN